jgi:hypothetical protein
MIFVRVPRRQDHAANAEKTQSLDKTGLTPRLLLLSEDDRLMCMVREIVKPPWALNPWSSKAEAVG